MRAAIAVPGGGVGGTGTPISESKFPKPLRGTSRFALRVAVPRVAVRRPSVPRPPGHFVDFQPCRRESRLYSTCAPSPGRAVTEGYRFSVGARRASPKIALPIFRRGFGERRRNIAPKFHPTFFTFHFSLFTFHCAGACASRPRLPPLPVQPITTAQQPVALVLGVRFPIAALGRGSVARARAPDKRRLIPGIVYEKIKFGRQARFDLR